MDDPIAGVIDQIARDSRVQQAIKELKPNFLNNVGEVFEIYGFATTRQYLRERETRRGLSTQARAVLAALDCMEGCESIQRNRSIGRLLIKTLKQCSASKRQTQGGDK